MTSWDIWTLVGLSLGTIGAVFLAYDVVYGAGKRFQAAVLKKQLENLRSTRKFCRDITAGLPQPPWTPAEIQVQLDEEEKVSGPQELELVQKVESFYRGYEDRVVTLGAFGVMLIVAGFVLQIIGLVVHAVNQ